MAGMKRTGGLGKGLDALLGDYTVAAQAAGVQEVDIRLVDTNPDQPRKAFDPERLRELSESIKRHGLVQPVVVRKKGERYCIVMGERRYRAARMAGLDKLPVVVREFEDSQIMEVALIENIQREDLNPIEEAAAIRFLMEQHDLTQEEVSERLAKSRPAIANALRLLNLPKSVQDMVRDGRLSAGHGRVIAGVRNEKTQELLAQKALDTGCSVRALEQLAKKEEPRPAKQKPAAIVKSEFYDMEERLRERLGAKVSITGTEKRGRIVIEYYSRDTLDELYRRMEEGS